jgi:hypothetical protein
MSDAAFFDVASDVGELNDGTCGCSNGPIPALRQRTSYATGDLTCSGRAYLQEAYELPGADGPAIVYGTLPGNIGYVAFNDLAGSHVYRQSLEEVLGRLGDAQGIGGGCPQHHRGRRPFGAGSGGHFATERRLYMTTRFRNGPGTAILRLPSSGTYHPAAKSGTPGPWSAHQPHHPECRRDVYPRHAAASAVTQVGGQHLRIFSDNRNGSCPTAGYSP